MSKATRRFIINKLGELVISLLIVTSHPLIQQKRMPGALWPHLVLRMNKWKLCEKKWGLMIPCLCSM